MATETPYQILGVKPAATADEIRKAYRKLAKQLHPDLNPGKPEAEARFKSVSAAYDLLSDPEKRGRYDRGEIDETGAERPRYSYRPHAEGAEGWRYQPQGEMDLSDLDDLFAAFGSAGRGRRGRSGAGSGEGLRMRGPDRSFTMTVDFVDAAKGDKKRLSLSPDEWLDVTIPAGIDDGQVLRLRGKGSPGFGGGEPGDALIEVHVAPHPLFRRDGDDIRIELPVSLAEAVLGARIPVPTVTGPVTMTIPKGSDTGTVLRLRGKGIQRRANPGDQYVTLKVVIGHPDRSGTRRIRREMGAEPCLRSTPRDAAAMIALNELFGRVRGLDRQELVHWVENRWVLPEQHGDTWLFHEVDVARVELILEIRHEFAIDDEAVPVVLDLLDQVYGLRRQLRRCATRSSRNRTRCRKRSGARCRHRARGEAVGDIPGSSVAPSARRPRKRGYREIPVETQLAFNSWRGHQRSPCPELARASTGPRRSLRRAMKAWMAGTSPAKTIKGCNWQSI